MRFNILSYFLKEGFNNVFKNKRSTFLCIGVMCATMLMFGGFYAIGENISYIMRQVEGEQGMNVFMLVESTEDEVREAGEAIRRIEGVNVVTFVPREEAFTIMQSRLGDRAAAMDGLEPTIFPDGFTVTLTDLGLNRQVQNEILELDNIMRITSADETIYALANFANWIRMGTLVILVLLVAISVFIIANTIKLTVHARRKEISIMKYVGATNNFIRTPFMIEGIVIGLFSGLISIIFLGVIYTPIAGLIARSFGKYGPTFTRPHCTNKRSCYSIYFTRSGDRNSRKWYIYEEVFTSVNWNEGEN